MFVLGVWCACASVVLRDDKIYALGVLPLFFVGHCCPRYTDARIHRHSGTLGHSPCFFGERISNRIPIVVLVVDVWNKAGYWNESSQRARPWHSAATQYLDTFSLLFCCCCMYFKMICGIVEKSKHVSDYIPCNGISLNFIGIFNTHFVPGLAAKAAFFSDVVGFRHLFFVLRIKRQSFGRGRLSSTDSGAFGGSETDFLFHRFSLPWCFHEHDECCHFYIGRAVV